MLSIAAIIRDQYTGRVALKVSEVARILPVSESHIYAEMSAGRFPSITIGGARLVPVPGLVEYLEAGGVARPEPLARAESHMSVRQKALRQPTSAGWRRDL